MLEQDRYRKSPILYVFGLVTLMLFWLFILLSLYIVPFLIWDFVYDVPEIIISWQHYLQNNLEFSIRAAKWLTFLTFAIPGLICMVISWIISNYIDNLIVEEIDLNDRKAVPIEEVPKTKAISSQPIGQSLSFALKIILAMLAALVILFTVEWLISVPPPATAS